jgi:O-acetyl-ADP-ribose deacetylase (regulator of RNase III)
MSVYFEIGNLLDAPVDYICHQVNCQGRMGSGIAKQIRERWPVVYEKYIETFNKRTKEISDIFGGPTDPLSAGATLLGHLQQVPISDKQTVINIFAQQSYGYDGRRYTSYDAFWSCLGEIKVSIPKGSKIGFPAKIGCGLGGANWEVIFRMIEQVLGEEYEVYIYMLEEEM